MGEYKIDDTDGIHTIQLPKVVDYSPDLEAAVKTWLEKPAHIHILDLSNVHEFKEKAYRPFVLFQQGLKSANKRLFAVGASPQLSTQLGQDGLSNVIQLVKSRDEALNKSRTGTAKPALDVEFINPFIIATQTVLETQANTKVKATKPYIKKPGESLPMQIAGVISLSNPKFTGSITICFRQEVFLAIYENMVGERHDKITAELEDAAGELLNIIFGQAKTILNDQKGYTLEKALPTILSGEKLSLRHQSNSPVIVLPFESSAGPFHMEVLVDRG